VGGREARAAIGAAVRARLAATKGVARIPKDRLEAYVVPYFLSREECEGLMRLIDARRFPSGLLAPSADPEFRTSESCNLTSLDPFVGNLEARINALMGLDGIYGEPVQGQRYAVGQQFKPHHDFFHTDQPYWKQMELIGGQRTWTVMAFLNKPDAGGQTQFPQAGLRVTPATAHLLIWNNLDVNGEPNPFTLHQGMPVEAGVKYILTKWYRERPFGRASA
jgi:prolyl 4-hydroxylase